MYETKVRVRERKWSGDQSGDLGRAGRREGGLRRLIA